MDKLDFGIPFKVFCTNGSYTSSDEEIVLGKIFTVDHTTLVMNVLYYHIKEVNDWVIHNNFISVETHRENQLNKIL
jgi:hypothetical protein